VDALTGVIKVSRQGGSERLDNLAELGESFYAERLCDLLEPEQNGRFVAVEPETGRYFIGRDGSEALAAAHEAMPDALFYLKRIGYEFAHRMGGRSLRRAEEG
jgi:hypothetical protein